MQNVLELAEVEHAAAMWIDGQVRIQVSGEVPESCWVVEIEQSPLDVWPPHFLVNRHRTSPICAQVMTPYVVANCFVTGQRPEQITLVHKGGQMEVEVKDGAETPVVARPGDADGEYDEAEGRSHRRFSFDEAFTNAVAALPVPDQAVADQLENIVVAEIWGEVGGIAGSHDLVVRVRRSRAPA